MKGMRTWMTLSNYERMFKKKYSISCDDDNFVFKKKNTKFYQCILHMVHYPKHKIQCQQSLISALINRQYILRIPKVLLTSNNPKVQRTGGSIESFRMAPLWCCAIARSDSKSFLIICLNWFLGNL